MVVGFGSYWFRCVGEYYRLSTYALFNGTLARTRLGLSPPCKPPTPHPPLTHTKRRFTNFTRDFKGTLDYILYTSDSLIPTATLELMDESEVRLGPEAGLPSEVLSSDHLALAVTFQYAAPAGEE